MLKLDYFAAVIATVAIVALSLWPLKSHDKGDHRDEHGDSGGHGAVHWSYYTSAEGPDNWGHLSPDFAACRAGWRQSPADISYAITGLALTALSRADQYERRADSQTRVHSLA